MYEDKTLRCKDCGKEFVFTAGEQECDAKKAATRQQRKTYKAVCDACGGEATVPFEPTEGRPVYCSECFEKMKNN